jgi:hypothetical protein
MAVLTGTLVTTLPPEVKTRVVVVDWLAQAFRAASPQRMPAHSVKMTPFFEIQAFLTEVIAGPIGSV